MSSCKLTPLFSYSFDALYFDFLSLGRSSMVHRVQGPYLAEDRATIITSWLKCPMDLDERAVGHALLSVDFNPSVRDREKGKKRTDETPTIGLFGTYPAGT